MAAFDTTAPIGTTGRFGRAFADALNAVATWNDRRMTRNALSKLSNRELDDIGLSRGDIEDIR